MSPALIQTSIVGAVAVTLAWLLCRLVPALPSWVRAWLWWAAAGKFLLGFVAISVPIPILPAQPATGPSVAAISRPSVIAVAGDPGTPAENPGQQTGAFSDALLALWTLGVAASTTLGVRQWWRIRVLVKTAAPGTAEASALTAGMAARLGLRRVPEVRASARARTPMVTGVRRPVIVLPASTMADCGNGKRLEIALCHELVHIRRRDVLFGCIPAVVERLFFFHPLAVAAVREYAFWREAACDAEVIAILDVTPHRYGEALIDVGLTRNRSILTAASASRSFQQLKRRLRMLAKPSPRSAVTHLVSLASVLTMAAAMVPVRLVARSSRAQPAAAPAPLAAIPAPLASARTTGVGSAVAKRVVEVRPGRVPAKVPDGAFAFVLFAAGDASVGAETTADAEAARAHRLAPEPLLWFRLGGHEYVTRQTDVLQRVRQLWDPVAKLQSELRRQGDTMREAGRRLTENRSDRRSRTADAALYSTPDVDEQQMARNDQAMTALDHDLEQLAASKRVELRRACARLVAAGVVTPLT